MSSGRIDLPLLTAFPADLAAPAPPPREFADRRTGILSLSLPPRLRPLTGTRMGSDNDRDNDSDNDKETGATE